MKTLATLFAGAALLAAPLAASAQPFHGGGFGGGHAAAAPAFHGGGFAGRPAGAPAFHDVGARPVGFAGRGFDGHGYGYGGGWRGGAWAVGAILPALYWDAYLSDPFDYDLAPAPYGAHWVTVDGEALLIQDATGAVLQVAPL